MLPRGPCVVLRARYSSDDRFSDKSSVARRDFVSHRAFYDDGWVTPLPAECDRVEAHAHPVLDDVTLGDRHPSFRAEGEVPDTNGRSQRHRKLHAIAHKIASQWRRMNLST